MGEISGIKKCYFQRSIFRLVRSRAESSTDLYFNFDLCWWKTAGTRLRLNTTNQSWALGLAQSIIFLCLSQWLPASLLSISVQSTDTLLVSGRRFQYYSNYIILTSRLFRSGCVPVTSLGRKENNRLNV